MSPADIPEDEIEGEGAVEDEVEQAVARFLDLRERDQALSPERFCAELGPRSGAVLAAIRRTLGVIDTLSSVGDARPERVGPYRVEGELGRGAMGVVYTVERDGARYALKLWSPTWGLGARARERFEREARTLARVRHPGIVRVHDSGVDARCPYLVMELVEGESLAQLRAPLEPERAVRIVRDLARAVEAAHGAGVLHRDVKPQNVVLRPDGAPVLLDFGLVAAEGEATLTATGAVLGTPRYMAPEQARGLPAGVRSDVYALGLVLYELLFGRPARAQDSQSALLQAAAWREVRLPRAASGIDRRLARLLRACLAWSPERRTPSAGALATDLERWLTGERVRARPPALARRAIDRARARPARAAWIGGALLALLATGGTLQLGASQAAARSRARVEERLDLALTAWFLGSDEVARGELAAAVALDPRDAVAVALERALGGEAEAREATGDAGELEGALGALAAAAPGRALPALERAGARAPRRASLVALRARALALAGRDAEAAWERERARGAFPDRAAAHCLEALSAQPGAAQDADGALAAALERAPGSGPLHAERSRRLLRAGRTAEGVREAASAARLHAELGVDFQVELPRLLALASDGEAVRAELAALLEREPDDADLWFALAWSNDDAHRLGDAERAYRRCLEVDPGCVRAALNLAHLHAGAQLGSCRSCDEAYAREPELLAPQRSLEALQLALEIDRGGSDYVLGRVVQTALDLGRRAPELDAARRLAEELERTLVPAARNAAAGARLQAAALRLRSAVGD